MKEPYQIGRKKNNFVGGVSFKLYLCHSLNSIPKITIFGGYNKARACESSGFNVLNSKMAQNGLLTQPPVSLCKKATFANPKQGLLSVGRKAEQLTVNQKRVMEKCEK